MEYPESEKRRIATLRLYKILDTAAESAFDDLTQLAAAVCNAPISLVSFVDEERQWFKSRTGLTIAETPREHSFCSHAILTEDITVVSDAMNDVRFKDNPLVTADPNIRFYAGAPLQMANGEHLGTLCVIDRKPRSIGFAQRKALGVLRDAVVTQIEYRRSVEDLKALESLLPLCAWCHRVKVDDEEEETWIPLYEYVKSIEPITHGICPVCRGEVSLDDD